MSEHAKRQAGDSAEAQGQPPRQGFLVEKASAALGYLPDEIS
jgi:hypothetical protein